MVEGTLKFASPLWFWAVPALIAGGLLLWYVSRRIAEARMGRFVGGRFVSETLASLNWPGLGLRFALPALAMILLAVALARPLFGPLPSSQERQGVDIVIALDVSKSMTVDDVKPSRLTAIKQALSEWFKDLSGDRIGLVVFAGDAIVQAPITSDFAALDQVLQQANIRAVSRGGTNIPRAIEVATRMFERQKTDMKAIVIVTDGENFEADAIAAAREARGKKGVAIFTVGVGTAQGGKVYEDDYGQYESLPPNKRPQRKSFQSDGAGSQAFSKLDERSLRAVAQAGGGSAYMFDPDLKTFSVLRDQGLLPLAQKGRRIDLSDYGELFQFPLGMAILLLVLEPLIRTSRRREVLPAAPVAPRKKVRASRGLQAVAVALGLFLLLVRPGWADTDLRKQVDGLLESGKTDEAVELMREHAGSNEKDFYVIYNYALTLYRAGKFEEAGRQFEFVESLAPDPALRAKASVQIGNALYRRGESLVKAKQLNAALAVLEDSLNQFTKVQTAYPSRMANANLDATRELLDQLLRNMAELRLKNAEMFAAKNEPWREEEQLNEAVQLYDRLAELNPKAADIPPKQAEVREKLARAQVQHARRTARDADAFESDKRRTKELISKRKEAIQKYEEAQAMGARDPAVQEEKQRQMDKLADIYVANIKPKIEPSLAKEEKDMGGKDEKTLQEARKSLEDVKLINPHNAAVNELDAKAAAKLDKYYQKQGEDALKAAEAEKTLAKQLTNTQNAKDSFQKALEQNPDNKAVQEKVKEIDRKLPAMLEQTAREELAKAEEVLAKDTKPEEKNLNLREAVGHLEKATQTFDAALTMKPDEEELEKQRQKAEELLASSRKQMQQMAAEQKAAGQKDDNDKLEGISSEQKLGSLTTVKKKEPREPKSDDAFWQRNYKDW